MKLSRAIIDAAVQSRTWVTLFRRAQNGGKGAAVKDGLELAERSGYSHVLQIDADRQHDCADIERFFRESRGTSGSIRHRRCAFQRQRPACASHRARPHAFLGPHQHVVVRHRRFDVWLPRLSDCGRNAAASRSIGRQPHAIRHGDSGARPLAWPRVHQRADERQLPCRRNFAFSARARQRAHFCDARKVVFRHVVSIASVVAQARVADDEHAVTGLKRKKSAPRGVFVASC